MRDAIDVLARRDLLVATAQLTPKAFQGANTIRSPSYVKTLLRGGHRRYDKAEASSCRRETTPGQRARTDSRARQLPWPRTPSPPWRWPTKRQHVGLSSPYWPRALSGARVPTYLEVACRAGRRRGVGRWQVEFEAPVRRRPPLGQCRGRGRPAKSVRSANLDALYRTSVVHASHPVTGGRDLREVGVNGVSPPCTTLIVNRVVLADSSLVTPYCCRR